MQPAGPVYTVELFAPLLDALVALLRSLPAAAWKRPTVARAWTVHDIAAHLLDGDLRKLAAYRDGHQVPPDRPLHGPRDLVAYLNDLNASGVEVFRRLSPRLLTDLLGITGVWIIEADAQAVPDLPHP